MIRAKSEHPAEDSALPSSLSCSSMDYSSANSSNSTSTGTTSPSSLGEETQLMEALYDKEPKSTELKISCTICGDRASGFHYGVHACEGCKGFFRRTVRMRLQYKECQIGCKVNIKSRNKCQYCRFQKCIKSGMSHDAIRFGRMSRVEKNRIITQMAKEEPSLLDRKKIEAEQEHLKNLSETILHAFHKHFSMTRSKMSALWAERSLPGVTAPVLDTLEDVKILYPQLFAYKAKEEDHAMDTQQWMAGNAAAAAAPTPTYGLPNAENSPGMLLPDDISFSSASSDSGSDELLSAVKKIAIPYPQYENMNMTPDLSMVYNSMPTATMQETAQPLMSKQNISPNPSVASASTSDEEPDMNAILYTELRTLFEPDGDEEMAVQLLKKIEVACQNKVDVDELLTEFPGFKKFFEKLNISTDYLKTFVADLPTYGLHSFLECARQALLQNLLEQKLKRNDGETSAANKSTFQVKVREESEVSKLLKNKDAARSLGMQIVKFLYQNMQKRLVKGVCELTEFSKNIPRFCELALSDQVILLKYGSYEALFVMLGAMIFKKGMLLPEGNIYVTFDFVNKLGDIGQLMKPKFEFAEKIASMNLQDEELSLFAAAIILFGDRPGLVEREKVEKVQSDILRALETRLKISHPNDSQLFARLLLKMTDLRQLVADHVTMVERLIKIHSIKKLFHPLITEIIKDRE